ncbi:MAG: hypothetical protein ABIT58_10870 [Ferruginibacter sp.]
MSPALWQNFGHPDSIGNFRNMLHIAFDSGITHFDFANNYGPSSRATGETFGKRALAALHFPASHKDC